MNNRSKRLLIFILIISATLHLLLFIALLLYKQGESLSYKLQRILPKKSAKVIFKKPSPKKRLFAKLASGHPTTSIAIGPKPQQPLQKKQKEAPKEPLSPQPKKVEPQKKQAARRTTTIKQIHKKKLQKLQLTAHKPKPTEKKPVNTETKNQRKITLADITKRFLRSARSRPTLINNQSNNLVSVTGIQHAQATEEQLKHNRYGKKLLDCIRPSAELLLKTFQFIQQPKEDIVSIRVLVNIHKKGSLKSIDLLQSSGYKEYDLLIIKAIREGASSFPPVPSYFNTNEYSVSILYYMPITATGALRQYLFR